MGWKAQQQKQQAQLGVWACVGVWGRRMSAGARTHMVVVPVSFFLCVV